MICRLDEVKDEVDLILLRMDLLRLLTFRASILFILFQKYSPRLTHSRFVCVLVFLVVTPAAVKVVQTIPRCSRNGVRARDSGEKIDAPVEPRYDGTTATTEVLLRRNAETNLMLKRKSKARRVRTALSR